jgi:5-formyltetrahydrofolate cyclo-ligase
MRALKINSLNNLKVSDYGVLEPEDNSEEVFAKDMNLAIIPGLVFDLKGGRIGYGGGFYDRFFSNTNIDITKIALAYQFQILEELPLEDHDVSINNIITENGFNKVK